MKNDPLLARDTGHFFRGKESGQGEWEDAGCRGGAVRPPTMSRCPISGPSIGVSAPSHTIRHRRPRVQMGLTLLLLRRAGEQLVKDVECPLHFGLPDDPRLLQEIRLCKGGKKNALRWEVTRRSSLTDYTPAPSVRPNIILPVPFPVPSSPFLH